MLRQWKTWLSIGLFIPPTLVLALHAYNGAYTRLIADDYCSIYFAQRLGFLRDIWFWYTISQGRYSLFAMDTVLTWFGTGGVGLVTTLALLLWGAALVGVLAGLPLKPREWKSALRDSVGFASLLLFLMLLLAPNVPQSLYWWNGLATHTMPLIVFTIYLAIYQWSRVQKSERRILVAVTMLGFGLSIIAGGYSETFTAAQIALLSLWLGWLYIRKELDFRQPGPAYLASGLAGALISLVIAFISPGNAERQSFFTPSTGVFSILQISFVNYFAFIKDLLITPEKILGLAGTFLAFVWLGRQIQLERSPKNWEPPVLLVINLFLLTFACFTPAAVGMSDAPPTRAVIIPAFFVILGTVSAAFTWGNLSVEASSVTEPAHRDFGLLLAAVVLIMASASLNGKALYDSNQVYIKYAQAWDENEQKILEAAKSGQETVIIRSVRNWAGLNDPGDNPKFYVNYCMSKFYEINILADNTGMQAPEP